MRKIFLLMSLTFIMGCTALVEKQINIAEEINGKTYILQGIIEDSEINIRFSDDRLNGDAGVNFYFSSYELAGNKISVGEAIGTTMMAGPENLMEQERDYLKKLSQAVKLELNGERLTLSTAAGSVLIFYEKFEN